MKDNIDNISISIKESLDDSDSNNNINYIQPIKHFTPESYNNNYRCENIKNYSIDNKIIPKNPVDIKISYIGDIKNEFGIYSNKLSKIEKEAESYAVLKKKIQLIRQMKFENQTLKKIKNNIKFEYLPSFDVKDCFKEKNKIFFHTNKPVLLRSRKKNDINCKSNKINGKYLTYLINFNKNHKNKFFTSNIFDNMNKTNKSKEKKTARNNTKIQNIFNMNFTSNDSFLTKKFSSQDNNKNNLLSNMLQVKKIPISELNKIHSRLYGGNSFKKSFNENKENYPKKFKYKKIFGLYYSPNNRNRNKYNLFETSPDNKEKKEKIYLTLKEKFNINRIRHCSKELIKNRMFINIERKYINKGIGDEKVLTDYKYYDSSSFESNNRKK